ncbi:glycoside hydrolase family 19 protein [Caulobacter sp. 17J80-11]|uniref:glycoside hydrolase family 19 protein n=1 Tax=Caulobacter sp. 17J80-11 TaxID=2763502 RepID=UPI001653DD3A|nr:glycoside hydrolase family 19 protein [Caulobacter sp. 17J80-11]MBC6982102.1 glycoside hydrolase family 19 protein [Caulobacter sp. 17J80-11]
MSLDPLAAASRAAITFARLAGFARGLGWHDARRMARALEAARFAAGLSTPRRVAHFMAQLHHESAGFTRLEESFRYRPERLDAMFSAVRGAADAQALLKRGPQAVANRVYAGRLGNGDEASGDGWRYRGRGLVQLTGRANYAEASEWIGRDLEAEPDLAAEPEAACEIAAAWWARKSVNEAADRDDLVAVTRAVNGPALAGLKDRETQLHRAKGVWR